MITNFRLMPKQIGKKTHADKMCRDQKDPRKETRKDFKALNLIIIIRYST